MIRRLILLRHGQTEYNATDRMQGQLDTDLSELGRSQAKTAAAELATREPIKIVSSDLRRALDTANALGDAAGVAVSVDERLRETHLGQWQGLTHTEVDHIAPRCATRPGAPTHHRPTRWGEPHRRRPDEAFRWFVNSRQVSPEWGCRR
ncbi:histidine phosphatase family protein, partial [Rhodococcus sp. BS-15]|uniref:histidine phosphatase family protein n=1 Tax=Rhodococcus sp. BS-15 TaxID=1304954 RepID=UPI001F44102E